jgi:medium-chain acyl-[acyl-carrier-protein] hydrolase
MRSASPWILSRSDALAAKCRLFCLPFAGGGASAYGSWQGLLGPEVDVLPVQLPGRENRLREPAIDRIDALARQIASAIGDLLDLPFALFGHSMGALVAFELARELRRQSLPAPRILFASGKPAPQLGPDPLPMGRLPNDALLRRLHQDFGLDLSDDMRPLIELMLPTIRADICAVDDYRYATEEPFRFPIVALGGERDESVRAAQLQPWSVHTTAAFRVELFPGDHFFVDACRPQVAALVRAQLSGLQ